MAVKLEKLHEDEETNALVNASLEFATRNKETITSADIQILLKSAPLMLRCFHDFGYHITKIEK